MSERPELERFVVDLSALPAQFPTHRHAPQFWEHLGRTVATFAFLEEILGKAIFAFTATRRYSEEEAETAFEKWRPKLEKALTDPLGKLIGTYGTAVRENGAATISNLDELLDCLRKAAKLRNVLCHGSWRVPDTTGRSTPLFVNSDNKPFEGAIDEAFLAQTQKHVAELACAVISSVAHMGWRFPGWPSGPGKAV